MITATELIKNLSLEKHIEGGYFKRVYQSNEMINLPNRFAGERHTATSIYFLLEGNDFSAFHRIKSDEIWSFNYGTSLTIHVIDEKGHFKKIILGDPKNPVFQTTVYANQWFAAELNDKSSFALVSCIVSPGFDFKDFELADRKLLVAQYPEQAELVIRLIR